MAGQSLTARARKATAGRIERAIEGYRATGSNVGAAKAAGVSESTLRNWRAASREFAEAVHAAIDECAERDGQAARAYVSEHIEALRTGKRQARQVLNPRTGDVVEVLEPIRPETSLIQAALRRWDARYRPSLPAAPVAGGNLEPGDRFNRTLRRLQLQRDGQPIPPELEETSAERAANDEGWRATCEQWDAQGIDYKAIFAKGRRELDALEAPSEPS